MYDRFKATFNLTQKLEENEDALDNMLEFEDTV